MRLGTLTPIALTFLSVRTFIFPSTSLWSVQHSAPRLTCMILNVSFPGDDIVQGVTVRRTWIDPRHLIQCRVAEGDCYSCGQCHAVQVHSRYLVRPRY